MSRLIRAFAVLTSIAVAVVVPAQIALASVPYPPAAGRQGPAAGGSLPTVVHVSSGSGVGGWAIVLVAVAAMLVGVLVAQVAAKISRRGHSRPVAA